MFLFIIKNFNLQNYSATKYKPWVPKSIVILATLMNRIWSLIIPSPILRFIHGLPNPIATSRSSPLGFATTTWIVLVTISSHLSPLGTASYFQRRKLPYAAVMQTFGVWALKSVRNPSCTIEAPVEKTKGVEWVGWRYNWTTWISKNLCEIYDKLSKPHGKI